MTDMLDKCAKAIGAVRVSNLGGRSLQLPSDWLYAEAVIRALMEPTPEMVEAGLELVEKSGAGCGDIWDMDQRIMRDAITAALRTLLPEEPKS